MKSTMMIAGSLRFSFLFALVTGYQASISSNNDKLRTVFEWKDLEYGFPTEADRQQALNNQLYVPHNGVPIDVDVHYKGDGSARTFITIPRFVTGIPYSLATVSNRRGPNGPLLEAYPNYNMHRSHGTDCNGITSIFRVAIDECNRLWMVDTGRVDTTQYCPPQVLVYNLDNDLLLFRYQVPAGQYVPGLSLFITPIVDIPNGQCNKAKLYVADVQAPGLLVFDAQTQTSWRIQNKWMYPDPDFGTFTLAKESFNLMDGMFGMSLTPKGFSGERNLYFHPLASDKEASVPLRAVNNASLWTGNPEAHPELFTLLGNRGVQCAAEAMDRSGNSYCCLMEPLSIFSWNINTPYQRKNFNNVVTSTEKLQFASGMKVIRNRQGLEELWVCTNRLQKVYAGTMNYNEVNFRFMALNIMPVVGGANIVPPLSPTPQRPGYGGGGGGAAGAGYDLGNNLIFT